jgi:hypothetical protein
MHDHGPPIKTFHNCYPDLDASVHTTARILELQPTARILELQPFRDSGRPIAPVVPTGSNDPMDVEVALTVIQRTLRCDSAFAASARL